MIGTAKAIPHLDAIIPPFGMAPIERFLQIYNRQLSYTKPAMDEWWVFGGFLDELVNGEERQHAESMLCQLAAAGADCFDRVCSEVEALAAPYWNRRMQVRMAAVLDDLHFDQTGARLAALAVIAEQIGWNTGDDQMATGFGTRRSVWRFSPRGTDAAVNIVIRAGAPPSLASTPSGVDLDFSLSPDGNPAASVRAAFHGLAELTASAAANGRLVDLPLRRRLELLRGL